MIAFIGGANWDVTMRCARIPRRGESVKGSVLYENPGGTTLNAASVSAALGIPTLLVSRCGDDEHGRAIRDAACRHHSLRTFWLSTETTNTAYILLDGEDDAERTMICTSQDADVSPSPPPHAMGEVRRASIVDLVTGEDGYRAEYLRRATGRCCVDVKYLAACLETRSRIEIVVGSQGNRSMPDQALLQRAQVELCVMTAGADGGEYWTPDDGWQQYQPLAAGAVVDACGAGDAFRAGLLVGLHRGLGVNGAIDMARWCGAQAVGRQGAWCWESLDYPT